MTIGSVEASFIIFAATNVGALIWREAIATQRAKDLADWRSKVDKALGMNGSGPDGAYFARVTQVKALADQLRENREATEKEFAAIVTSQHTDRMVFERRLSDQSRRLLALAKAAGLQVEYDSESE